MCFLFLSAWRLFLLSCVFCICLFVSDYCVMRVFPHFCICLVSPLSSSPVMIIIIIIIIIIVIIIIIIISLLMLLVCVVVSAVFFVFVFSIVILFTVFVGRCPPSVFDSPELQKEFQKTIGRRRTQLLAANKAEKNSVAASGWGAPHRGPHGTASDEGGGPPSKTEEGWAEFLDRYKRPQAVFSPSLPSISKAGRRKRGKQQMSE